MSPLLRHDVGISVMMRCLASDSELEGSVDHGSTGTPSEVCPSSGGLGEPVTLPTDYSLLYRVADIENLNKAWRIVCKSALNSQSSKIVAQAKAFDQDSIRNLRRIESALKAGSFVFDGVYARLLPREGKNPRPLAVAKIEARIVQRGIHDILLKNHGIKRLVKPVGKRNSFGGIKSESTKHAIEELCKCFHAGYNYYIASDIKDFFQGVSRQIVHEKIFSCLDDSSINSLIEDSVKCEIVNASSPSIKKYINLFPRGEVGVIQGCCLSPLYGNIYLEDFDLLINSIEGVRCLRYIDDFIILAKHEGKLIKSFDKAMDILSAKGLAAYKLDEEHTKASFGDIRRGPVDFLGCSIAKGQVRPQKKARESLCVKIDTYIKDSLKEMVSSCGKRSICLNYINTITKINNTLKGWGGAFSFCNDKSFFERLDAAMMEKISDYYRNFRSILSNINGIKERQRLFGLQMLVDCVEGDLLLESSES